MPPIGGVVGNNLNELAMEKKCKKMWIIAFGEYGVENYYGTERGAKLRVRLLEKLHQGKKAWIYNN